MKQASAVSTRTAFQADESCGRLAATQDCVAHDDLVRITATCLDTSEPVDPELFPHQHPTLDGMFFPPPSPQNRHYHRSGVFDLLLSFPIFNFLFTLPPLDPLRPTILFFFKCLRRTLILIAVNHHHHMIWKFEKV